MDLERTIQFIGKTLADVELRQKRAAVRSARMDQQIRGLEAIAKTGERLLGKLEQGRCTPQNYERWLKRLSKALNSPPERPN